MAYVQVIVKLKTQSKQTTQKKNIYGDNIAADITDPQIDAFISEVTKEFGIDPKLVEIKTSVTLKLFGDD